MNRIFIAALIASAIITSAPRTCAAESSPASSLETQEARYKKIRQTSQSLPSTDKDWRGKTMRDDIQGHVLTPATESEINRLRSQAQTQIKQGQMDAARETVGLLSAALDKETKTFQDISTYWGSGAKNVVDRAPYLEYLRKNGVEPQHVDEIEALRQKLAQQLDASQFAEAATQTYPELQRLLATAGKEETEAVFRKVDDADFTPFLERKRTAKCASPPRETSGSSKPRATPLKTGKEYYPAPSKRLAEEGTVYVMARVSAEGCAQSAAIISTSGFRRLDEATLDMMLDIDYLPAEENGQRVPANLLTKIQWQLQ
jgi:TonB family protein